MGVVIKNLDENKNMTPRENPIILRQGFTKLWQNNLCLKETAGGYTQFINLHKSNLVLTGRLHYRFTKTVSTRFEVGEQDIDSYNNIYKYRKNQKKKKLVRLQEPRVVWSKHVKTLIRRRFVKAHRYQQRLQEFSNITLKLLNLIYRMREPSRRLIFMNRKTIPWRRRRCWRAHRQKHFINTVHQVIFLHYYKVTNTFALHFARELEKVRKKIHWQLIRGLRSVMAGVPTHPKIRRQYYGSMIQLTGRPKGRNRTVTIRIIEGSFAPLTYRFRVSYGFGVSFTKVGVFGVKLRIAF